MAYQSYLLSLAQDHFTDSDSSSGSDVLNVLDRLDSIKTSIRANAFGLSSYFRYQNGDLPNLDYTLMLQDDLQAYAETMLDFLLSNSQALSDVIDDLYRAFSERECTV